MKHLNIFKNQNNYNEWLASQNWCLPNVSKIKTNNSIVFRKKLFDKEIEYLESSGLQYITLDYIPQGNDIEIGGEFMLLGYSHNTPWCGIFSTYVNEQTNTYRLIRWNDTPMSLYAHNNTRAQGGGVNFDIYINTKYNFVFTYDTLTVGDMSYDNKKEYYGNENTAPMIIFGSSTCCRFYSFYIKKNNKLVLDLIPVRDNNNIGYMYDKINGKLYCSSTNFILGQDK